jgi:hypothetical protein
MAHTPGPWLYREPQDDELHEIYSESSGDLICFPVWTHNQRANVPLIAAAPELLAALKFIRDDLLTLDGGDVGNGVDGWRHLDATLVDQLISGSFRVAYAAIAKAEARAG